MREVRRTDKFDEGFWSLDKALRERVIDALDKIDEHPGKPLHAPHTGFFSKRIGPLRLIYTIEDNEIVMRECRWRKKGY